MRALVRRPGPRLAEGLVTHQERVPVNVDCAQEQWSAYVETLAAEYRRKANVKPSKWQVGYDWFVRVLWVVVILYVIRVVLLLAFGVWLQPFTRMKISLINILVPRFIRNRLSSYQVFGLPSAPPPRPHMKTLGITITLALL